ncbi:Dihydroorotate dehydrogenase (quinone), mitochondrial [Cryptotrichosporon argae]
MSRLVVGLRARQLALPVRPVAHPASARLPVLRLASTVPPPSTVPHGTAVPPASPESAGPPPIPPPPATPLLPPPSHSAPASVPPPAPPSPPSSPPPPPPPPPRARAPRRWLSSALLFGTSALLVAYYYDARSLFHEHAVMPAIRAAADPETGHVWAVRLLALPKWLRPHDLGVDGHELRAELFGIPLSNPVGIAAGFDKDAAAIDGLFDLGFGYVEVGSVTPEPQPGNPKPRFFRLAEDDAAINRYGFNSLGHGEALARLRRRVAAFAREHPSLFPSPLPRDPTPPPGVPRSLRPGHVLAVNLGKNKVSAADSNDDYVRGMRALGPYADVVVVNVSSPNTPGLRALQGKGTLKRLLGDVVAERDRIKDAAGLPKVAVKVACDLADDELADVAAAVRETGVDGVIISNTTVRRAELGLTSEHRHETGGLSGRPLFPYALQAVRTLRPLLPPSIPIIGAGGIWTGSDALAMAGAGASIVQVYTSFGYRGVGTAALIKDEIARGLAAAPASASTSLAGAKTWASAIGQEYENGAMGWDEDRVRREGEHVRKEAEGLAELLRHIHERNDLERLVEKAEEALGRGARAASAGQSSAASPADASHASAQVTQLDQAPPAPGQTRLVTAPVGSAAPASPTDPISPHTADAAADAVCASTGQPAGADLSSVAVVVEHAQAPPAPAPSVKDDWRAEVRRGTKRLV